MIYSPVGRTAKKTQIGRLPPEDLAVDRCRSPPTEPWTSNGRGGNPPGIRIIQVMDEMLVTFIERTMEKRLKILKKTNPTFKPPILFHIP